VCVLHTTGVKQVDGGYSTRACLVLAPIVELEVERSVIVPRNVYELLGESLLEMGKYLTYTMDILHMSIRM
jgi:hypothetical protein